MSKAQLSDYKEVFQLFDKNEDGVLSFSELGQAMQTLGHRIKGVGGSFGFQYYCFISGDKLLDMVSDVSEDTLSNTVEFNEFLKIMSKKENEEI